MELERRYLAGLRSVTTASRAGDTLTLTGPDVILDFERDAPSADADLTGTPWVLESLVDGESVSSTVPGGRLVLREDGTFVAATGCGDLLGSFRVDDGTVTVSGFVDEPVPAKPCSEQVLAQREHVVDVLRDGFEAQVDGDRLTLTSAQGLGLDFRAE
jgi:heat shock protein HslJ